MHPKWKVAMERYQEIALSEYVMKSRLKRPIAEDWRWRHIRLAIKARYLGNHASKLYYTIKRYQEVHGRSSRIRHEKSPEAPPGGEITMTSYWLGIKPRYLGNHESHIKCYYGSLFGSHAHSFRIRHEKSPLVPPSGGLTMTSYPVGNKASLSRKPCIAVKSYYGSISWRFGLLVIFI